LIVRISNNDNHDDNDDDDDDDDDRDDDDDDDDDDEEEDDDDDDTFLTRLSLDGISVGLTVGTGVVGDGAVRVVGSVEESSVGTRIGVSVGIVCDSDEGDGDFDEGDGDSDEGDDDSDEGDGDSIGTMVG